MLEKDIRDGVIYAHHTIRVLQRQHSEGQGGVNCISGIFHGDIRRVPKVFLKNDIRDGVAYAHHARRKTLTAVDVLYALKGQGCTLYSFGGYRVTETSKKL